MYRKNITDIFKIRICFGSFVRKVSAAAAAYSQVSQPTVMTAQLHLGPWFLCSSEPLVELSLSSLRPFTCLHLASDYPNLL